MNKSARLFRLFGIDVRIHFSWWFVFILMSWSLATSYFPQIYPGFTTNMYWGFGIVSALLLFISVLLHELSHSLVARAKKIKVESITLFFFGGVAGITKEDIKPSTEFFMAIAGPLFSFFLAGTFYLISLWNVHLLVTPVVSYLAQLNLVLAIFNLIPGFPLDGGRAFRALLYGYYKDLRKATKIASSVGKFFAAVLIILGFFSLFSGVGNGLWFILLGGFLYFIAGMSYEQVVIRQSLVDIMVKDLVVKRVSFVDGNIFVADFLRDYAYSEEESFLVKCDDFFGVFDIRTLPQSYSLSGVLRLKQVAVPLEKIKTISLKENAYDAFHLFSASLSNFIPVMEKGKFMGIVTRRKVMSCLLWKARFGAGSLKKNV